MKLIPAIDLKNNKCVRLNQGREDTSKIYSENPVEQAMFFENQGCEKIHIVDLDAAFGRPEINKKTILNIRESTSVPIQLGGGIKDKAIAKYWLENKINYLVLGSIAVTNKKLVVEMSQEFENKIYIAMDVINNKKIMIDGWTTDSKLNLQDIKKIYNKVPVRGYIITNIDKDGMMEGPDKEFLISQSDIYMKPLIFSGGFSDYESLEFISLLNKKNKTKNKIEGVILGKALYTGDIEIGKAIKILNKNAQN